MERLLLAAQHEVTPACFNFLLKSHAALIYRLALAAGVAAEIARVIRDGAPSERRAHGSRAHQHHRPRDVAQRTPPRR
jgi:hypothetical protein